MDKGIEALINEAKQSSFVMEYISNFQSEDIDSDDVDLRFEADGVDTGCDVSIVDQCGKAATLIDSLIAALEQAQQRRDELAAKNEQLRKILHDFIEEAHQVADLRDCPFGVRALDWLRNEIKIMGGLESELARRDAESNMAPTSPLCVKPLCVKLPDSSNKAFWSGVGKTEQFHPETYKRWVKESIERAGVIAGIQVEVK